MTKKNLKPQQSTPVQREINTTTSSEGGITGLTPQADNYTHSQAGWGNPFAGDEAE